MSILSLLNSLVLRDTSNAPLTNKGSALSFSEGDGNAVKIYNAIQDIVSGVNVPAYDAAKTYDFYSTDVSEKFVSYASKIWSAVYIGSPSSFSGQTPAESAYWTQVTLAQMLGNPVALTKIANNFDDTLIPSPIYETEWNSSSSITLFTVPITLIDASVDPNICFLPYAMGFQIEAGSVPFDFSAAGLWVQFLTASAAAKHFSISQALINSGSNVYLTRVVSAMALKFGDKVVLTSDADATVGDGTYHYKLYYRKVTKQF